MEAAEPSHLVKKSETKLLKNVDRLIPLNGGSKNEYLAATYHLNKET